MHPILPESKTSGWQTVKDFRTSNNCLEMKANRSMLEHSHSNGTSIQDVIKMQSRSIQDAFMKQSSVDNQGCQESIRTGSNFGYSSLDLNSIKSIQAATPGPLQNAGRIHTWTLSLSEE